MELPSGCSLFSTKDFAFVNSKKKLITIRIYSLIDGITPVGKFIAGPINIFGTISNVKFRTTGETTEEALYSCINLLADIEDLEIIQAAKKQQDDPDSVDLIA